MCDIYSFYAIGVNSFGPLFVKSMFSSDISTMRKLYMYIYIYIYIYMRTQAVCAKRLNVERGHIKCL